MKKQPTPVRPVRARYVAVAAASLIIGIAVSTGANVLAQSVVYPVGRLSQSFAGYKDGWGWTSNSFSCDSGYSLKMYHFDENSSNNATWYACVKN